MPSNTLMASRIPWPSGNLSPIRLKVIPSISIGFKLPRSTANYLPLRPSISLKLTLNLFFGYGLSLILNHSLFIITRS